VTPDRWRRLRRAVEAALEALPERRESVLLKECAGDSSLMAEARSLLQAAAHTGGFLDNPPAMSSDPPNWPGQGGPPASVGRLLADRAQPLEVRQDAARRLKRAALVVATAYAVSIILNNTLRAGGFRTESHPWLHDLVGAAVIALSVLVALVAHRNRLEPARLLDIGLAYEVLTAFAISLQDNLTPVSGRPLDEISWLCVLIVIFPLLVPARPAKMLAASLAAASMWPVAFFIGQWLGNPFPSRHVMLLNFLENYIAVVLALGTMAIVRKLGADVEEARRMGSYELIEPLGRGGMGEVWRARHNWLARPAAIKLIDARALGFEPAESLVRRFEREAQATAALHSPHTVELYDFGVTLDGIFYYVMELLDGLDLEQLVRRFGPVPPERAVHILLQACDSLADAHYTGLVHRDVKPANLYVCRKGLRSDFVKLLDFGLVKRAWSQEAVGESLTGEGLITGTPAYLAPEAALGSPHVDGRADLYALGCVAYWLLTGEKVFEADSPMQMIRHHIETIPVPPSRRAGRSLPPDVEAIVLQCLEKAPDRRPADAEALAEQLSACRLDRGWTQERAREWWRANLPA
jgi:eukaryotic-like serine/threonine-protein kinase